MLPQGRDLKRGAQATAFIVATACLLSNIIPRESFPAQEQTHSAIGRRGLLADQTFDVTISCDAQGGETSSPTPLFTINFGRAINRKNPLALFSIEGANRVDVVYSQEAGLLWVLAFVADKAEAGRVTLYVDSDVTTAMDTGASNGHSSLSINYVPPGSGGGTFANVASWGMAGSLALSLGAAALSPFGTVGVGVINMAGFAQTFAMSGNLPITNLPENYRSAASNMEWVALQPKVGPISPAPTEEQIAQAAELADLSSRFPSVPVLVTLTPGSNEVATTPAETPETTDAPPSTTAPSVVVMPLPEQELVNNNGTRPTPFKPTGSDEGDRVQDEGTPTTQSNDDSSQQENDDESSNEGNDDSEENSGNPVLPVITPPSNQVQSGTGPIVDVPSTTDQVESTTGDGGDTNPPGSGGLIDRPATTTPPATPPTQAPTVVPNPIPGPVAAPSPGNAVQGGEEGNGPIINVPALPPVTPGPAGNNTVVVDIPAQSPPPVASPPLLSPPPKVPVVKPLPLPGSPPPGEEGESPSPAPDGESPPPEENPGGGQKGDSKDEGDNVSPEPTPTQTPTPSGDDNSSNSGGGTSPVPTNKDLPFEEADKEEDATPSPPSGGHGGHGGHGHGLKPLQPLQRKKRRLFVSDPLAALSSSGFSYVVVTATVDDASNATDATSETVGASALSRIRTIQAVGEGPGADSRRLKALWDVLFWTAIAVAATLVLHLGVLGLLYWAKKPVPKMLHLPRMELLVFMMTLPMIAAAGAALFRSTTPGIIFLGVFFSVLLPFGFLGVVSVFLVRYLLRTAVERRRALYVLVATQDPTSEHESRVAGNPSPLLSAGFETSSRENSLTAHMLGPDTRDSISQVSRSTSASDLEIIGVVASEEGPSGSGSGRMNNSDSGAGPSTSGAGTSAQHENNQQQQQQTSQVTNQARSTFFHKAGHVIYQRVLRPVFGFQESHTAAAAEASTDGAAWLGRGKWDAEFVKRYGCFFEDTHGPQVLRVRSRYDPTAALPLSSSDEVVGSGVLVPATPAGTEGALQALQTFGVVFAVTKMVLFAVIINGPGGVNNMAQVLALVLVAAMHVVYLRMCTPYRLRVELAAEMVASTCDLAIFACGVALIAKREWSPSERHNMGIAMLALQAVGFLIFITVRVALGLRTLVKTVGPAVKTLLPQRRGAAGNAASSQFVVSS